MDDSSLHFAQPLWMLAGGLVCAGLLGLFVHFDRRREADLARLVHPRFRQRLTEGFSPRLRTLKRALWLLALWLGFVAVARPQKGFEWHEVKRKGIDILFAVDTSRSMLAEDLTPNRLERARLGILDFVARMDGDRVGLIPFAGSAFALCPLTLDYDAFRESLNALDTGLIPRQGTDLASAIKEAGRLFDENGNNHRALVLLTDGEDLQGDVFDAVKAAAQQGMFIFTVGVGSAEGATMPVHYQNGRTDYVRDAAGKVVRTVLDETTLKKIAVETHGLYVPLGRGAEGLNTIYQEKLRLVPQSEQSQRMERIPLERFEWPLAAAIALWVLEFLIGDRRRPGKLRRVAAGLRAARPAAALRVILLLGLLAVVSPASPAAETPAATPDPRLIYNQGTQAYTKGDFAKAADALRSSLRTPDLALQQRSYYNLGNSLYRTGQGTLEKDPEATLKTWETARKAYQDCLALNPDDPDARFNQSLVEKKLEQLKQQQKDNKKDDQKDDQKDQKDDKKDSKDGKPDDKPKDAKDGDKSKDGKDPQDAKEGDKSKDGKDPKDAQDSKDGKDGKDGKDAPPDAAKPGEEAPGAADRQRAAKQEMTPEEAKQLLEALRDDERTVIPIPQQRRTRNATPDNSTRGKTW